MSRWTVITENGLTMLREDIFNAKEAKAFVAANPKTTNGTRQLAVPEKVARDLAQYRQDARAMYLAKFEEDCNRKVRDRLNCDCNECRADWEGWQ